MMMNDTRYLASMLYIACLSYQLWKVGARGPAKHPHFLLACPLGGSFTSLLIINTTFIPHQLRKCYLGISLTCGGLTCNSLSEFDLGQTLSAISFPIT